MRYYFRTVHNVISNLREINPSLAYIASEHSSVTALVDIPIKCYRYLVIDGGEIETKNKRKSKLFKIIIKVLAHE